MSKKTDSLFKNKELINVVKDRVLALLDKKGGDTRKWMGNMTELNQALRAVSRKAMPANWPISPSVMRKLMNNVVYYLRREGVKVSFTRTTDRMRKRIVEFIQR